MKHFTMKGSSVAASLLAVLMAGCSMETLKSMAPIPPARYIIGGTLVEPRYTEPVLGADNIVRINNIVVSPVYTDPAVAQKFIESVKADFKLGYLVVLRGENNNELASLPEQGDLVFNKVKACLKSSKPEEEKAAEIFNLLKGRVEYSQLRDNNK